MPDNAAPVPPKNKPTSNKLPPAAVAGIVTGAVVVGLLILALVIHFYRSNRTTKLGMTSSAYLAPSAAVAPSTLGGGRRPATRLGGTRGRPVNASFDSLLAI